MMEFRERSNAKELMDDPHMDPKLFKEAFKDINRCNNLLGGYQITIDAVMKLIKTTPKKSYTILDVGCADGAMLRKVADALKKEEIDCKLTGIDVKEEILKIATQLSSSYDNIDYVQGDLFDTSLPLQCDILLCTLTLHHFTDEQIHCFAKRFADLAKIGVVINDLHRSKIAYVLFNLFSIFFIKTRIGKLDGLVSIARGFTKNNLKAFAKQLPKYRHSIQWKWAFRYVWIIKPAPIN
ncbi:MAG: methyltransferase domain-containing protein [Croceitalea sp.]|nr:methyltransferase domain-containing protein [Croceitalea sp.]